MHNSIRQGLALGAAGFVREKLDSRYVGGCLMSPDYVSKKMKHFSTTANPADLDGACSFIYYCAIRDEHTRQTIQQTNSEMMHK